MCLVIVSTFSLRSATIIERVEELAGVVMHVSTSSIYFKKVAICLEINTCLICGFQYRWQKKYKSTLLPEYDLYPQISSLMCFDVHIHAQSMQT